MDIYPKGARPIERRVMLTLLVSAVVVLFATIALYVFDWASLAAQNPHWLANDHIHCSAKGYQHRATAIAQATSNFVPVDASRQRSARLCSHGLPF